VGIRWGASSLTMEFVLTAGADPMISMADECHENYKAKRWNWRSLSCRGGPVGDQTTSKTLSLRDKEVGSEPPRLGIRCFGPAWSQRHRDGETVAYLFVTARVVAASGTTDSMQERARLF